MPFSPSVNVPIVRAVDDIDTATSRNWAPINRPVRPSAGVYMGSPHILGSLWTPANAQQGKDVLSAMQAYRFEAMGFKGSFFDFYLGFGWLLGAYLLGHAILFRMEVRQGAGER